MRPVIDLKKFWSFCSSLAIADKENPGGLVPLKPFNTQRYVIEQIAAGLEEGVHTFTILKFRQAGMTTIGLALDLYWLNKFPGIRGTFVADSDSNREEFRATIDEYAKSVAGGGWHIGLKHHNRNHLILENKSRLTYQVASSRNDRLGQGKGITYGHFTECASWDNDDGLKSLMSSLAETNPHRLYIFESTAQGYNLWYSICKDAKESVVQKFIFLGWWMHERYRFEKDSPLYRVYWDGKLDSDERQWTRHVKQLYGHEVQPEQIAWWRYMLVEKQHGDLIHMKQEYPPTEHDAFQLSGSKFFDGVKVNEALKGTRPAKFLSLKYQIGSTWNQSIIVQTIPRYAELKMWEAPHEGAVYVVTGDPAYGSSEWKDNFCLSEDTEVLTSEGWKTWEGIKKGDRAVCFDMETEEYRYGDIQDVIVQKFDGDMVHVKTKTVDCLMTPEHRAVIKLSQNTKGRRKMYPWSFRRADDLPKLFRFATGGAPIGNGIHGLTLEMCRVMGWIATDGSVHNKAARNWALALGQSENTIKRGVSIRDEMDALLKRVAGVTRSDHAAKVDARGVKRGPYSTWYFGVNASSDILRHFTGNIHRIPRYIIEHASREQLSALFLGLMEGDGTARKNDWIAFYPGNSEGLADDLQEIAMRLGYCATKSFQKSNLQWVVHLSTRPWHCVRKPKATSPYRGVVWDITVPMGAFVARRKGKTFVTGNCAQVFRCYADGMDQVAEYASAQCSTEAFAWLLCYLAGFYKNSTLILEINGPGEYVWNELLNLRRNAAGLRSADGKSFIGAIQMFMYRRIDSTSASAAYQWKSTHQLKIAMLTAFKDNFESGRILLRSPELCEEMVTMVREEDGDLRASGRGKDDRIIAAGMATVPWLRSLRVQMQGRNLTRALAVKTEDKPVFQTALQSAVSAHLADIGYKPQQIAMK